MYFPGYWDESLREKFYRGNVSLRRTCEHFEQFFQVLFRLLSQRLGGGGKEKKKNTRERLFPPLPTRHEDERVTIYSMIIFPFITNYRNGAPSKRWLKISRCAFSLSLFHPFSTLSLVLPARFSFLQPLERRYWYRKSAARRTTAWQSPGNHHLVTELLGVPVKGGPPSRDTCWNWTMDAAVNSG